MLPELFTIGSVTFYSYGLMTALAIITAIWAGEYETKKTGLAEDGFITGMGIACVIGGYASSKLLFWITILPEIIEDPAKLLDFSHGFVVFGGLIGGVLTAYLYCRKKKTDFWAVFDLIIPFVALAQCIGRIGCFLAGCCYGQPTDSIFGIIFHSSSYAPTGIKLFPIQLVSAGLNLFNFLFLFLLWKKAKLKTGMIGALYIITYSIGRFFLEYFRGDLERGAVGAFSTSQFISLFTLLIGLIMLFFRYKLSASDTNER
ncbi:MAG: prolipoprotein diacylglyceryl transferase [Lachnospiraceae bacterium]|nr:prolipoprotein diacylglyceryl transferase [Lachnospiraceae bacterium]